MEVVIYNFASPFCVHTHTQPLQFIENLATQPDYVFKILVVGNSYVGKSSFLMRLCTNAFSARYSSTIGERYWERGEFERGEGKKSKCEV